MDEENGTVPLDESLTETVDFHGRAYQKYALANGTYYAPIDEDEIARLELMHSIFHKVFDNRLIFPPISSPKKILDCGCGAGDWAVQVARRYPECEILGIDISPHMIPEDAPRNLEIQIDDLNGEFTFPSNEFDLVHSQMMAGGINAQRWRSYLRDILRVLRPGGWCQMVEMYFNAQSDNGTLKRDAALSRWSSHYLDSLHPQKDLRAALQLPRWMRSAGFTEVETRLLTLPMCAWSNDARERSIGEANSQNVPLLLHSLALYPLTQLGSMPIDEFDKIVEQAKAEASNPSLKAYFPL
ncbi:hypothetical protein CDD81_805 [Ophiocordyceps australis]|uniref:Methyltransferase domain-containing protein n=1 Tax=Ophiocordyceps australis TaxID=1399860 RepID=A0A2C5Y2A0_9HYPO|nr:hypothetical protein CDD81_805 [Ophiocordyceps australis]